MTTVDTTAHNSATILLRQVVLNDIYDLFREAKNIRESKGLTQAELGEELGFSASMVSKAEKEPENVTLEYWYKYIEYLGLEMDTPKFNFQI